MTACHSLRWSLRCTERLVHVFKCRPSMLGPAWFLLWIQNLLIEQVTLALHIGSIELKNLASKLRKVARERDQLRQQILDLTIQIHQLQDHLQMAYEGSPRWKIRRVLTTEVQLRHWIGVPSRQDFNNLLAWLGYPADKKISVYQVGLESDSNGPQGSADSKRPKLNSSRRNEIYRS